MGRADVPAGQGFGAARFKMPGILLSDLFFPVFGGGVQKVCAVGEGRSEKLP